MALIYKNLLTSFVKKFFGPLSHYDHTRQGQARKYGRITRRFLIFGGYDWWPTIQSLSSDRPPWPDHRTMLCGLNGPLKTIPDLSFCTQESNVCAGGWLLGSRGYSGIHSQTLIFEWLSFISSKLSLNHSTLQSVHMVHNLRIARKVLCTVFRFVSIWRPLQQSFERAYKDKSWCWKLACCCHWCSVVVSK